MGVLSIAYFGVFVCDVFIEMLRFGLQRSSSGITRSGSLSHNLVS